MSQLTDVERRQFILDLDESDLELTDWEVGFISSILIKGTTLFTERQVEVINQMISKYDDELL